MGGFLHSLADLFAMSGATNRPTVPNALGSAYVNADAPPMIPTQPADFSNTLIPPPNAPSPPAPIAPFLPNPEMGPNPIQQGQGQQPAKPPETKGHKLLNILQAGLQGALAGRASSEQAVAASGGHRSGGFGTGFEAGFTLPWQRQQMENQLAQQRAQTELTKAQSQMVDIPGIGPVPFGLAKTWFPAQIAATSREKVQGMKSDTAESVQGQKSETAEKVANIHEKGRMDVETMKQKILDGTISRVTDGQDPDTGAIGKLAFNRTGKYIGFLPGSLPSSKWMPTETDTISYQQDADGNIIALPKPTIKRTMLPGGGAIGGGAVAGGGAAPAVTGGAAPAAGGTAAPRSAAPAAGGPRIVAKGKVPTMAVGSMPDGTQVAGTNKELSDAGATGITKMGEQQAGQVVIARQLTSPGGLFDLSQKDLDAFKPGELEGLAPRWNEFLAGKIGAADPRYIALRTHLTGLLSTALMQAHVGSRGGEHMMEHFQDLANAGKMNKDTLQAALDAEKLYVEEKAMRPKKGAATTTAPSGGVMDIFNKWKAKQQQNAGRP